MTDIRENKELESNSNNIGNNEASDNKEEIKTEEKRINEKESFAEQKNNKMTAIIFIVLIVVIIASGVLYKKLGSGYENGIMPGENMTSSDMNNSSGKKEELQDAPAFEVEDSKGDKIKLSDMKGKPVVVNFWASWCGPCKSEMPDFDKLYKKYGEDIEFMMVNMTDGGQETKEGAAEFIKSMGYEFPVYYDVNLSAANAYSVMSIPATYFINEDGKIAAYAKGAIDEGAIEEGISRIK
jgi:thiol-disulfide isomerase/thioredoxin